MARLRKVWRKFIGWATGPRVAALLLGVLSVLIGAGGYLYRYCPCEGWPNLVAGWDQLFLDFYANAATTFVGFTVAVLTIDLLNERRADRQLRKQLIREMCSPDNGIALRAVQELQAHGSKDDNWLTDGSLKGAYLIRADLHSAHLSDANLQRAILQDANLRDAFLLGANLQDANLIETDLQGANLEHTNLQDANLSGAKLQKAKLGMANLQDASLFRANLYDAELYENDLSNANLENADLREASLYKVKLHGTKLGSANLKGAGLMDADLQGVEGLTELQLVTASCLLHATMQDGSHYNGRFNLDGDTEIVQFQVGDDEAMARWYGVPIKEYRRGQKWAQKNLARLRREAELEWGDATPRNSPLRASAVLAKSLLSFTVRRLIGLFWPFLL